MLTTTTMRLPGKLLTYLFAPALLWAVVALLFASESYLSSLYRGRPIEFVPTLGYSLAFYGTWALVSPVVIMLARRWRFMAGSKLKDLLGHSIAGVAVALSQAGVFAILFWPVYGPMNSHATRLDLWAGMIAANFPSNLLIYAALAGGTMALAVHTAARDREAKAAQLQARLAQAELDTLRAQIHPHFLFNTLHGISALVRRDPLAAERLIAKLGTLLRSLLDQQQLDRVPLRTETGFLHDYLEIEQMRFGDRLAASIAIDDNVGDALVPPLLLQPLVENAIRHGLAPASGPVNVVVRCGRARNRLTLAVSDDGAGIDPAELRDGKGLGNLRARLKQMFGADQTVRIETKAGGGFKVTLELPLLDAITEARI